MKENKSFEQKVSGKLQNLQGPDMETSWQQMKTVLDDNLPRGGSGGGGFTPYGKWWWVGAIAIVFTIAIWFMAEQHHLADQNIAVSGSTKNAGAVKADNANSKNTDLSNDNIKADGSNKNLNEKATINSNKEKADDDNTTLKNEITNSTDKIKEKNQATLKVKKTEGELVVPSRALVNAKTTTENKVVAVKDKSKEDIASDYNTAGPLITNKKTGRLDNESVSVIGASEINKTKKGVVNKRPVDNFPANKNEQINNGLKNVDDLSVAASQSRKNNNNKNKEIIPVFTTGDKLSVDDDFLITYEQPAINTALFADDSISNKAAGKNTVSIKLLKEASILTASKENSKKAVKTKSSFSLGKLLESIHLPYEGEKWWAAGLSMNSAVATGAQNRYSYNVNAKSGTITDYLPSPYLQYHVNSNLYLQTEFNFSAPQYTSQLLISQKTKEIPASTDRFQQSVYVQKLYYFNWPLSVHYSPVKNLFLTGGLQFSSLQSGLKTVEEKRITSSGNDPVYISPVEKFKDDTIAAKLTPNEWRWETGANYYISRFTIGVRYNNSFSDLVNIKPSPTSPVTISRNSAFLLFLRYNLWESRKKPADKNYYSSLIK